MGMKRGREEEGEREKTSVKTQTHFSYLKKKERYYPRLVDVRTIHFLLTQQQQQQQQQDVDERGGFSRS